jgi:hypothetical protein
VSVAAPLTVGVFDAQDEDPAGLFGQQPVEEGGSRTADVE